MKSAHETDFLPAALEIQERPPSPLGRAIVWTLMLFFTLAIVWAVFGRVDIVTTAQGKIVPSGRVKVIQPQELGRIQAIHVREGQQVKAGDLLIELDSTSTRADQTRLESELQAAEREQARLAALLALLEGRMDLNRVQASLAAAQDKARLRSEWKAHQGRQAAFASARRSRGAEAAAIDRNIAKLEATLPLITKRATATKRLVERSLAAETTWLELEQQRIEQRQDLASLREQRRSRLASIDELEQQARTERADFSSETMARHEEAAVKVASLRQELNKAASRNRRQQLRAPVDGVVQELAVHTLGGVVTPAQELMKLVPRDESMEVQAWLANRDVGFIQKGQSAEIKIETFPFTKYGVIDAEILDVSSDAVEDEQRGLIYAARVLMRSTTIQVNGRQVNLTPGMAVTVEVKTGTRRLIEFLLAPLLKYADEGLRER
ncbi:MAG TPA: HlyD family type I secretion periplasmic adaptor subunit [Thiohalobacter sp.]|nr:HlyD family type I secretion periplasmic adaptor subunit [Thiohalobacter sp.]